MNTDKALESISKKLGVLIALNLVSMNSKATITENVEMLNRFGLSSSEISEILNTSPNVVHVMKSRIKKQRNNQRDQK